MWRRAGIKTSVQTGIRATRFSREGVSALIDKLPVSRFWPGITAFILALVIALGVYGKSLFDLSIPIDGDVRAHIFKIDIVYASISRFSWPDWIPYWYHGYPFDLFYPPGFYILGAILTALFGNAVIAYKVLLCSALVSNGVVTYYFARKFMRLDPTWSVLGSVLYESSTPLLVNYLYGEGPNLVGWSLSLVFLVPFLKNIDEQKNSSPRQILIPGLSLGIAILVHPFPVIFVSLAAGLYFLIRLIYTRSPRPFLRQQLPYSFAVFTLGIIIGTHYWLPATLNLKFASSIYTMTEFMWPGGMTYVLMLCALAFVVGLIVRIRDGKDLKLDFLLVCLFLAAAMGLGATRYFPLGLGMLLHEFRFATIMAPFFAVLILCYAIASRPVILNWRKIGIAFAGSALLVLMVFSLEKKEFRNLVMSGMFRTGVDTAMRFFAENLQKEIPALSVSILLSGAIFLAIFSQRRDSVPVRKESHIGLLTFAFSLLMITTVVPFGFTYQPATLSRLFTYAKNYQTPPYAEVMEKVKDGRLVVSMIKGGLCEGDSPVTFGWRWGVETVNGPYSQGDPKFFRHTVHLEWEDRWLDTRYTRENLMQESGARYLFARNGHPAPEDLEGLNTVVENEYGTLFRLEGDISRAVEITPVLLDVADPDNITDFFNILVPSGYKVVFADVRKVDSGIRDKFSYVLIDNDEKLAKYPNKQVLLIQNIGTDQDSGYFEADNVATFRFPYQYFIAWHFYRGEQGNGMAWLGFDRWKDAQLDEEELARLDTASGLLEPFLSKLEYRSAGYHPDGDRIVLDSPPGFTLVKNTYFPYWSTWSGRIVPNSQGFMLVYSDQSNVTLRYEIPVINKIATAVTIASIAGVSIALAIIWIKSKGQPTNNIDDAQKT